MIMFKVGDKVRLKIKFEDKPRTVLTVLEVENELIIAVDYEGDTYHLRSDFLEIVENFS